MAKKAEAQGPRILRDPKIILNIFSDSYYCCKSRILQVKELNNNAQLMKNNEQEVCQI